MDLALLVGYASAFGWIVSSGFWFWAAQLSPPIKPPRDSELTTFRVSTDGPTIIGGFQVPTAKEYDEYLLSVKWRNSVAAGISGVSAFLSALSMFFVGLS